MENKKGFGISEIISVILTGFFAYFLLRFGIPAFRDFMLGGIIRDNENIVNNHLVEMTYHSGNNYCLSGVYLIDMKICKVFEWSDLSGDKLFVRNYGDSQILIYNLTGN